MRRFVSHLSAAFIASVRYYVAALGIGLCANRAQNAAAGVGSIAGIYVYVQRAKAKGAMVTRGIAKGQNLFAAILTNEACVVFCKSFTLHKIPLFAGIIF